jgi:hyperosmotically inducible periplasmic protein
MKSRIPIICLLAGSMIVPGAAYAWGANKSTQSDQTTPSAQTTTRSANTREAVSDATITTKVKAELAKEKDVSATRIHVDTDNGVVKLSGTARSRQEADRAASIAQGTKGVVSVDNNIQVASAANK